MADQVNINLSKCPYCELPYRKLGNHLPFCKMRNGRDYTHLLSQKNLSKRGKSSKKPCPICHKTFLRLDTHLRNSSTCQSSSDSAHTQKPAANSELPLQYSIPLLCCATNSSHITQLATLKTPRSEKAWLEANNLLASIAVPAVLEAPTVDSKNEALCSGIYRLFSSKYGKIQSPPKPHRVQKHARCLRGLPLRRMRQDRNSVRPSYHKVMKSPIVTLRRNFIA